MSEATKSTQGPASIRILEWVGTFFGIAGAVMIASRSEIFAYGWIGFAVSSVALAIFAFRIRAWGLLLLQMCFIATNGLGLWRWLIEPAIHSGALSLTGIL